MPNQYFHITGNAVGGLEDLSVRLGIVAKRLEAPGKWLQDVAMLYEMQEYQLFMNSGMAPEFGYGTPWATLKEDTIKRRRYEGIQRDSPLVAFGSLRSAAINPNYKSVDLFAKQTYLSIDPRTRGGRSNVNYGAIQNATRPFAEIKAPFRALALQLARKYFFGPLDKDYIAPELSKRTAPAPDNVSRGEHKDMIRGRKSGMTSVEHQPKAYADFQMRSRGRNVDHRTTASKNLQSEYSNVMNTQNELSKLSARELRGNASTQKILENFSSRASYQEALQKVQRFHVANADGNAGR